LGRGLTAVSSAGIRGSVAEKRSGAKYAPSEKLSSGAFPEDFWRKQPIPPLIGLSGRNGSLPHYAPECIRDT
jgi:hypothetical protein